MLMEEKKILLMKTGLRFLYNNEKHFNIGIIKYKEFKFILNIEIMCK